jgi:hypothetical protein
LITSGTLGVANGGTGTVATPTNGQLHIGNGSGFTLATLTSGTGINVVNAGGSITLNATADASTKVTKAGDTMTGALTLPANGLKAGGNQLVLANGNVGIGTSNPLQGLELAANLNLRIGGGDANPAYTYDLTRNISDGLLYFKGNQTSNTGYVFGGVDGERMRITPAGNVGVGTATPQTSLEIYKSVLGAIGPTLTLNNPAGSGGSSAIDFQNYGANSQPVVARVSVVDDSAFSSHLTFSTKTTGASANPLVERMRLTTSGNVGIGTTSPGAVLDVNGQIKVSGGTPGVGKVLTSDANGLASWSSVATPISVAAGAGMTGGTISGANSSGTISLATVGTAGSYVGVTTDSYGRVVSATSQISSSQISNVSSSATASALAAYDGSGNLTGNLITAQVGLLAATNTTGVNCSTAATGTIWTDTNGEMWVCLNSQKLSIKHSGHLIFMTSTKFDGAQISTTTQADSACANAAGTAGLSGTFKAVYSSLASPASGRITLTKNVYNMHGDLVAKSNNFWSPSHYSAVIYNEYGGSEPVYVSQALTATTSTGAYDSVGDCLGLNSGSRHFGWGTAASIGNNGEWIASSGTGIGTATVACNIPISLMCIGQ